MTGRTLSASDTADGVSEDPSLSYGALRAFVEDVGGSARVCAELVRRYSVL